MSFLTFTKTELHNLFSKPATRLYPQQPRKYLARTRGHIENDVNSCIFCGMCSRKCPTGAITVDRKERTWSIRRFSCIQCGYCVENCPKKCLSMHQTYTQPGAKKTEDVLQGPPAPPKPPVAPKTAPVQAAAPKTPVVPAPKPEIPAPGSAAPEQPKTPAGKAEP